MSKKPIIVCLIVAAGSGSRMGADTPKQYMRLHGKMVLRHTIDAFLRANLPVQCVISAEHDMLYQQAVDGLDILPPVMGGATRQESVYNGLKVLDQGIKPDYVLIHDAARPCITSQDINNIIHKLENGIHAVTAATTVSETLRKLTDDHLADIVERDDTWLIQTPQAFSFKTILAAHDKAKTDNFVGTDDTSVASYAGTDVAIVPCGRHNIKITTQDDLIMASALLAPAMETRVGNGFDVHAFDDEPATHIRLCGIDIPYNRSLKGHSDADVGLHTITDAIFGAMADGDIGTHFPPSEATWKNMDSHVFLDKAVDNLKKRGGKLVHIDLTFMCEKPKIGKHREEIVNHLSAYLNLSTSRISVKATTTEKLGFTGREEGIAAQAVVTIQLPADDA